MRAGPKRAADLEPLDLAHLPKGRAARAIRFIEQYATVPRGHGAGRRLKLRPFQKEFIRGAFAPGIMVAGFSLPRGNGKTGLAAALCLHALFGENTFGPRVFACATSERQAMLLFGEVRAMVELHPELAARSQVHSSRIVVPGTDGLLEPLPASPKALQGYAPALVVVDEAAEVSADTLEAMQLSLGKTKGSLLIGISTAPVDPDSSWNRLRDLAASGEDPALYWREHSAPEGCDPGDPEVWKACNPAAGDFLSLDAIASSYRTTRLESFMRYRLNMPVQDAGTWIPWGMFEALAAPREIPPGSRIAIGFDGSVSGDSTALVFATIEERPHVVLAGLWEKPEGVDDWRVPRSEVTATLEALWAKYEVLELACDPSWWRDSIEEWQIRWPNVVEWPTHQPTRSAPATDRAYAMISEGRLTHDGDARLQRHVRNAVVRPTAAGDMIGKNHRTSPRRIDAAIAMIVALDRAAFYLHQPVKRRRVMAF